MKYSRNLLVLVSLVLLPIKASALSCAMISIAESCDISWYRTSGLDYNLCLESRKKQKMHEQAIEIEVGRLLRNQEVLRQRLGQAFLTIDEELHIEYALKETDERLVMLSPIYSDIRTTSCLRWMD